MEEPVHECKTCHKKFNVKSNLTRHLKTHEAKTVKCDQCDKTFTLKQHLDGHMKLHRYPVIRHYSDGVAILQKSDEASATEMAPVDPVWFTPLTAEQAAKTKGQELWRANIVLTFGQYAGKTFKWLMENDVGWLVWLLSAYHHHGENKPRLKWQKQQLLELVRDFPSIMHHLNKKLKKAKEKEAPADMVDPEYIEDAQLLALADSVLSESELAVTTKITTLENLVPNDPTCVSREDHASQASTSAEDSTSEVLEGWQKFWDQPPPQVQGIMAPNIHWLKSDRQCGLFQSAKPQGKQKGDSVKRKVLKPQMNYNPPPVPTAVTSGLPPMLAFFTTPVFFWRPVGVMEVKVKCPNANCPAPHGSYLCKSGYGNFARQVCGLQYYYTILTERLMCNHCMKMRQGEEAGQQHYKWHAYSPEIMMNLPPAVRSMFPAVICGKRAIDNGVVTLLNDHINAASMTKVQRLVQKGHDRWYMERRDLYQSVLYQAHTAQQGILPFVKPEGSYEPPLQQTPVPSARVLRRAVLIQEIEKMPDYRASIFSLTGEILCIDGTKQILKKIYGDGRGTMQYLTSVLNEWGQFLTTVIVAAESEECYERMARGLIARFKRANAPAPKILYTDNNCCRDGGTSWLESLFQDWADEGMILRLDIRHWLHRWEAVVIKQTHSKYGVFLSALAGAILAYNREDLMQLIHAVRKGNEALYADFSDEQMLSYVKPYQLKSYVRRVTRGVEESASAIEAILLEFKGPAGLDVDGIHLFKSSEAVDARWVTAGKHLSCMQDPPNIPLYVAT